MSFIEYLISKGYKPYRYIYNKNSRDFYYIEDNNINYFSSMAPGYSDIRLIKNNKEVIYGLHESNHPPVLIYPRPIDIVTDNQIDILFINNTYDEIYSILKL